MAAFIFIWFGQLMSTMGSGLTAWGLEVQVYEQTGSTTLFVFNLIAAVLPTIFFAPLAGVIIDRWDRRKVMILADVGAGIGTLSILLAIGLGRLEIWHIYLVTAISSTANTFQWPAYGAATTMLVPKSQLGRAGGMVQIGEALSQLGTPAIAGALFVGIGLKGIIFLDLFTLLMAIGMLLLIRVPMAAIPSIEGEKKETFWREMTYGWRYLVERTGMFGLLIYFAVGNFFVNVAFALFTPMMLDMTTPDVLGYVGSIGGVGMVIGTVVMSAWGGPRKHRVLAILLSDTLGALAVMMMGLSPLIPVITAAYFVSMFSMPLANGNSQALWQTKVAPEVQGRVFSVRRMIAYSIIPLAYLAGGYLSDKVFGPMMMEGGRLANSIGQVIGVGEGRGNGLLFVVMGALWAATALGTLLFPRVRLLEIELPDSKLDEATT
jgi:DHA3 family macrolide efflux protein-like MFS transporter